jgi:uncharacterized membrane protein YhaH (DUF805 family)
VSSTPNTPAGWYPNPERAGQLRYWDGEAWTDHVHDEAPAAPTPEPQPPAAPPQQFAPPQASEPPPFTAPGQPTGRETIAVPSGGFGGDAPPQAGAPPQFGSPPPPGFGQPSYAAAGAGAPETPGFIGAYTDVFKNYANFSGRLSVGGYWRFFAVNIVVYIVLFALVAVSEIFFIFYGLYSLALLVPSLAAGIRRLHDTGKSGWMVLIAFIPLIGSIILIVFLASGGDQQPNQYGPPPVKATA